MLVIRNTENTYGAMAQLLHWLMALLIIGMLALGLYMTSLNTSITKLKFYGWHKEIGILILTLVTLRMLWRVVNITPSLPPHLAQWQRLAAHGAHYALYFLMLTMPITGWLMSSAAGLPVSFFGLITLPDLIMPDKQIQHLLATVHEFLAYSLMLIICAHVTAALQHHLYYKDTVLKRMLPW